MADGTVGDAAGGAEYDTDLIRPPMSSGEIEIRIPPSPEGARALRKGLRTLHTLELMAVNIYRFQISRKGGELDRHLIAAMCNEMTHLQDFQVKLFEYGFRPSPLRWAYWTVGFLFGSVSRLLGRRAMLRTGIWAESKAVDHYAELLDSAPWDEATRRIIEKDRADEDGHIGRWREMLGGPGRAT